MGWTGCARRIGCTGCAGQGHHRPCGRWAPRWAGRPASQLAQPPALGDRDLLLLRLRQLDLGDAIHQVARCPHCASKVDVDFLISELPLRPAPEPGADGLHAVHIGQHTLYLRTPTGADQEAVETLALHNPAAANTRLFSRLVQRIEGPGGHEGAPDEAATRAWPMARRQALAQWLQSQLPGPDLYLDLACPHCQSDMSYVFDLHGFFLPRA